MRQGPPNRFPGFGLAGGSRAPNQRLCGRPSDRSSAGSWAQQPLVASSRAVEWLAFSVTRSAEGLR